MRETKPRLLGSFREFKVTVHEDIYLVICNSRDDDSNEMNNARAYELEKILYGTGDLDVKIVNGKRITQFKSGFYTMPGENVLEFYIKFGHSLAKAFETPVWLRCEDKGEFLITGNYIEKASGDISTAIERILGEKIDTIQDVYYRKVNNGSIAEHNRASINVKLKREGINAIATIVTENWPEYDDDVEPERLAVMRQIRATID